MSSSQPKGQIDALTKEAEAIEPPFWLAKQAQVPNDVLEREHAERDPEGFWREKAQLVEWMEPFREVARFDLPRHEWFVGGKLNVTESCIDRHVDGGRRLKAALIWCGEDGAEETYTYGRLQRAVCMFANALKKLGVARGDRVILYMPLTPEGIVSVLACARIGAIHSVVFAGMGTQALRSRIIDCNARVVVCADYTRRRGKAVALKSIVDEAVRGVECVEHVVVHRRSPETRLAGSLEKDFYAIQDRRAIHCPPEPMDAEDPLFILYTSGTTGKPKGVVHACGGYLVGVTYLARAFYQIGDRDVYWSTSDIGWIVGHSFIVYGPLSVGATVFVREGVPDYPSPEVTWELVERHGVNLMFTAPTAVRMWMSHGAAAPAKYDLRSLRILACAGEPLNPEAHLWAQKNLVGQGNGFVLDNFWQTEVAAPVLGTLPTMTARPGKVGKPLPGIDAVVVDALGNPVPDGAGGLLALRKPVPYMLRTVWGDHARYEKYWQQLPGMYAAGDIAVRHADGYFSVLGRADDVIKVAGHRIGTADVESSLVRHACVAEAAVIGLPDPIKGERIKAYVVLRAGIERAATLVATLIEHVRVDLGPIAAPSDIEIRDTLPKTRSGKIVRRYLKAQEMGEDPGDLSTLAD